MRGLPGPETGRGRSSARANAKRPDGAMALTQARKNGFPAEHQLADKGRSEIIPKLLPNCRLWQQKGDPIWGSRTLANGSPNLDKPDDLRRRPLHGPPLLKDLYVLSLCSAFSVGTRVYIIILPLPCISRLPLLGRHNNKPAEPFDELIELYLLRLYRASVALLKAAFPFSYGPSVIHTYTGNTHIHTQSTQTYTCVCTHTCSRGPLPSFMG